MRDNIIFYKSFLECAQCLNDNDRLAFYDALLSYGLKGEDPQLNGHLLGMFNLAKPQIDANNKRYENGNKGGRPKTKTKVIEDENQGLEEEKPMVINEKTNGYETEKPMVIEDENQGLEEEKPNKNKNKNVNVNKNKNKNVNVNKNNNKKEEFTPPTLEEVTQYCNERKNNINPQKFIDFYTSKGWYVGKTKMVDWKASVRTWELDKKEKPKEETLPVYSSNNNLEVSKEDIAKYYGG